MRSFSNSLRLATCAVGLLLAMDGSARAAPILVTVTNLAPPQGTFLTPVWVGFHDGTFDLYDSGVAASSELERLAEDGNTGPISTAFNNSGAGVEQGTLGGGPIAPGQSVSQVFNLTGMMLSSIFFSYASMVIPSNDAFIANGNPQAIPIYDSAGNFFGASFVVLGSSVLDAGTEVNDEIPANTAFLGQTVANTGVVENGVVGPHPGFVPGGTILSDPQFANANFLAGGYQVAQITISEIPEPGTLLMALIGVMFLWIGIRFRVR